MSFDMSSLLSGDTLLSSINQLASHGNGNGDDITDHDEQFIDKWLARNTVVILSLHRHAIHGSSGDGNSSHGGERIDWESRCKYLRAITTRIHATPAIAQRLADKDEWLNFIADWLSIIDHTCILPSSPSSTSIPTVTPASVYDAILIVLQSLPYPRRAATALIKLNSQLHR